VLADPDEREGPVAAHLRRPVHLRAEDSPVEIDEACRVGGDDGDVVEPVYEYDPRLPA
jgi:hypothetical protein